MRLFSCRRCRWRLSRRQQFQQEKIFCRLCPPRAACWGLSWRCRMKRCWTWESYSSAVPHSFQTAILSLVDARCCVNWGVFLSVLFRSWRVLSWLKPMKYQWYMSVVGKWLSMFASMWLMGFYSFEGERWSAWAMWRSPSGKRTLSHTWSHVSCEFDYVRKDYTVPIRDEWFILIYGVLHSQ